MKHVLTYFCFILSIIFGTGVELTANEGFPVLKGPYLGQKPPGMIPQVFASGIVSTEKNEHSPAIFSKNGNELFWSYYSNGEHVIMHMQQVNGSWTTPVKLEYGSDFYDGNPYFSADWSKLIFHSGRGGKRKDGSMDFDFWYIEKENYRWNKAKPLDFPPNSEKWELYGCQAASGNFYFTSKLVEKSRKFQLYISRFNGKTWENAEPMPKRFNKSDVNWTPYVSPAESYIIFSSDRGGKVQDYKSCDLYISFKDSDASWIEPINMGNVINTDEIERFPWVSPDEKYLFFVRGFGDIYWVDAKIIEELKPRELKKDKKGGSHDHD